MLALIFSQNHLDLQRRKNLHHQTILMKHTLLLITSQNLFISHHTSHLLLQNHSHQQAISQNQFLSHVHLHSQNRTFSHHLMFFQIQIHLIFTLLSGGIYMHFCHLGHSLV